MIRLFIGYCCRSSTSSDEAIHSKPNDDRSNQRNESTRDADLDRGEARSPRPTLLQFPSVTESATQFFTSARGLLPMGRVAVDPASVADGIVPNRSQQAKTPKQREKKAKKKTKKNAVVDHAEPRCFLRVIYPVASHDNSQGSETGGFMCNLVEPLLQSAFVNASRPHLGTQTRCLTWTNPPISRRLPHDPPSSEIRTATEQLVAWQHGRGVLYYVKPRAAQPETSNPDECQTRHRIEKLLQVLDQLASGVMSA